MRILKLIRNDMKFQLKYGFYLLYLVITMIYIGFIYALPTTWRGMTSALVVFSDPSALGLFFMGAIVLFEKSERVLNSLFIAPMKINEYILSKVISLSVISTIVGCIIVLLVISIGIDWVSFLIGLLLGSILFSLAGLIVATRVNSLNQFMMGVIPLGMLLSIPPFIILFGFHHNLLMLHPGVIVLKLILQGVGIGEVSLFLALVLILWIILFWNWARMNVQKMVSLLGGIRL